MIKRCAAVVVLAVLLCACSSVSCYLHPNADFTYIKRVAVLPLENLTDDKYAGFKVMDIVTTEILLHNLFDVVEWGEVSRVLKEEGVGKAATKLDKESAKRLGKRLGVQAIVLGAVEEYGVTGRGGSGETSVAVSLRMIDSQTSTVLWQASHYKKGGGILDKLFGIGEKSVSELAREVVSEMIDTLFD